MSQWDVELFDYCQSELSILEKDNADLRRELKNIRDQYSINCCICMENKVNICLLPCNHLSCCHNCQKLITKCPICQKVIEKFIEVYYT